MENGNPLAVLVGMQTGAAALENRVEVWRFLKKLRIELPYDPAIYYYEFIQRIQEC